MKLIIQDLLKLIIITIGWIGSKKFCDANNYIRLSESLNYFPFHLILGLGLYAIISVILNVKNIKNCDKEYSELISDIAQARKYYEEKDIRYN